MNGARKSVLMISDAVVATGFSRVGQEILNGLSQGTEPSFDLHQIGINYTGGPHPNTWPIYPAATAHAGLNDRLSSITYSLNPDVIILLNDPWVVAELAAHLDATGYTGAIVGYCPVDGAPLPVSAAEGLSKFRSLVAYTEFGLRTFQEMFDASGFVSPNMRVIPHGVDTRSFRPLIPGDPVASRKAAKAQLFPNTPKFQDCFVDLNGNRNQPRKRIDVTIRAFAAFAKNKGPNVMLYLHMAKIDLGWNIIELARRFGIEDRLIMSSTENRLPMLSTQQLNLMNAFHHQGVRGVAVDWLSAPRQAVGAVAEQLRHAGLGPVIVPAVWL